MLMSKDTSHDAGIALHFADLRPDSWTAEHLGITVPFVRSRRKALNLVRAPGEIVLRGEFWTEAEEQQLRAYVAAKMRRSEIAEKMGRRVRGVWGKISQLNISRGGRAKQTAAERAAAKREWSKQHYAAAHPKAPEPQRKTPSLEPIALTPTLLIPLAGTFYDPVKGFDLAGWNASRIAKGERPYRIRTETWKVQRMGLMTAGFSI
jgi:hypothetical protein